MFSRRVPASLELNALARALRDLRAAGRRIIDLTESNPTRAGFSYPPHLLDGLVRDDAFRYEPDPLGRFEAREAVAADYARRGVIVAPDRVALTTSTSESYSFLFKLLCDAGDSVLVPRPSYPLFDYLTGLDGVIARPYRLPFHGRWEFDVSTVADALDGTTRAVIVVAPNNPTGTGIGRGALEALASLCTRTGTALIGDEVFADYRLSPEPDAVRSIVENGTALAFSLGGLSKTAGLPQMKLGWIAVGGPGGLVDDALQRLEVIADAYLSVSTPVQVALPAFLEAGRTIRAQIADRVLLNYEALLAAVPEYPACRVPAVGGGWSAVIQGPAIRSDEMRARDFLINDGVLVHPGHLFDFERDGHFVVSLLSPPADFRDGTRRILTALNRS